MGVLTIPRSGPGTDWPIWVDRLQGTLTGYGRLVVAKRVLLGLNGTFRGSVGFLIGAPLPTKDF